MTNIIETIASYFKPELDDEPKQPLHVGEVMSLWTFYTALGEAIAFYGVFLNITTDAKLIDAINGAKEETERAISSLKEFMINEGIPLPDISSEKPKSDQELVPLGVRFSDKEIANFIAVKTAGYIAFIGLAMSQAVRGDVGVMFLGFMTTVLKYGTTLKSMMIEKGWITVPPYFKPVGIPKE
ncbi:DUF3231 family protein [Paenibacillus sp. GCM10023248]|uniref:DUF3231 family protein n=1 Tax=unclassified Paenibacillus TaxID=185978 RepID=UPI00237991B4|nr:DUF3231 family protein [Paenibacillus sp. MAHUQ-63]MDD9270238.1 DUF3231 family protein [Paenibacillus sp. MAHUQ-63]